MSPMGNQSVFCEPSAFLMSRALKEKISSAQEQGEVLLWR